MNNLNLNFEKQDGLIPVIIQDATTMRVLMLGFMNKDAFDKTVRERRVTFYSRTKQRLWTKGETSGNFLEVIEIKSDCDNDTLLVYAKATGPVCHTGTDTCFNEENDSWSLQSLEQIITDRQAHPLAGSYTTKLLESGINKIAQKVGEEAVELVIESKDNNKTLFLNEAADLMYHYLVLLRAKEISLNEVLEVLKERHKK